MDWRRWENICQRDGEFAPLRVTATLSAPLAGPTPYVHLDALLAWAAIHIAPHPAAHRPFAPTSASRDITDVPIPVARDESGVWCCSALWVPDDTPRGQVAWSQRPTVEHMHLLAAKQVAVTHGPTRARREHLTVWAAATMTAHLVGHPDWIPRLLDHIPSVGKKRSQGYGVVRAWRVEPAGEPDAWRGWGGMVRRPLPDPAGRMMGIRPPYWYRPWWEPAVAPGEAL